MTLYLDASVLLPTLVKEAASVAVDDFLKSEPNDLWISDFAAAEVASALSRLVRMGKLTMRDALERLSDFDVWRAGSTSATELVAADARLALAYVRRFELGLRAPDAMHAAIARRIGATLVTLDRRLASAATALGISVESLGA